MPGVYTASNVDPKHRTQECNSDHHIVRCLDKKFRQGAAAFAVACLAVPFFGMVDPLQADEAPPFRAEKIERPASSVSGEKHDADSMSNGGAAGASEPAISELIEKIKETEARLRAFRQISGLSDELLQLHTARLVAEANAQSVQAVLKGGLSLEALPNVLSSALIQQLRQRRAEMKAELAALSTTYLDKHPRMKAAKSQLSALDRQIRREAEMIRDGIEAEASMARLREQELAAELDRLKLAAKLTDEQGEGPEALEIQAAVLRQLLESELIRCRETLMRRQQDTVPEAVPEAPEAVPEAPETQPAVPEAVPEAPEAEPTEPEAQPVVPEAVPEAPEAEPAVPETQPLVPEAVPEAPEAEPAVPETQPEAPEAVPDASELVPELSETAPSTKSYVLRMLPVIGAILAGLLAVWAAAIWLRMLSARRAMRHDVESAEEPTKKVSTLVQDTPVQESPPGLPVAQETPADNSSPAQKTEPVPPSDPVMRSTMPPRAPVAPPKDSPIEPGTQLPRPPVLSGISTGHAASRLIAGGATRALFISPEGDAAAASSVRVAREVADAGLRVVLLDLTVSGAASRPMLESEGGSGVCDLLASKASFSDVIRVDRYSDCHVIPPGIVDSACATRMKDGLAAVMNALTTAYDLVVVECGAADAEAVFSLVAPATELMISMVKSSDEIAAFAAKLEAAGYGKAVFVTPAKSV